MPTYRVTDKDGNEVKHGDIVYNHRNEPSRFERVTRGIEYNGTAKWTTSVECEDCTEGDCTLFWHRNGRILSDTYVYRGYDVVTISD